MAIHTIPSPYGLNYGEGHDGILLSVYKRKVYYATTRIAAFGSSAEKLSEVNEKRPRGFCGEKAIDERYYEAISHWLRQVDHMELTGSLFGGIALAGAKRNMAAPQKERDADRYFDARTSRIVDVGRSFPYTSASQRYDPVRERRSGGSSHGGPSHSHSYSDSSGSSHSGSGRSF